MPSARLVRTTTSNVCPVAVTRTVIFSASIRCSAWRPNDQVDRRIVTGWQSHLADVSLAEEDRVHLTFWWTRAHFAEWLRRSAAASPAQR